MRYLRNARQEHKPRRAPAKADTGQRFAIMVRRQEVVGAPDLVEEAHSYVDGFPRSAVDAALKEAGVVAAWIVDRGERVVS
jgi:hypothetical protein